MSSIHFVWIPVSSWNWATVPFFPGSTYSGHCETVR
jgi:hypothetical protein